MRKNDSAIYNLKPVLWKLKKEYREFEKKNIRDKVEEFKRKLYADHHKEMSEMRYKMSKVRQEMAERREYLDNRKNEN